MTNRQLQRIGFVVAWGVALSSGCAGDPATPGGKTPGDRGAIDGSAGPGSGGTPGPSTGTGGASVGTDAAPDVAGPDPTNPADAGPAVDVAAESRSDGGPAPQPQPAGPWARGVRVGLVEATQGVFIKVGDGATTVAAGMRNAPLIEGRPLYARVHIATDAGFMARKLRAVLSLEYADKTKFEVQDEKMIAGASNVEQLATTFNFLVPADKVLPNSTAVASIYESGAAVGADPATPPRFPASGTVDLAIKAGKMELYVVACPVGMLMDTPERRKKLENDIYDLYPVQKVNLRIRATPTTIDGTFTSTKGFAALRTARETDNAKPWEYYHMIISTNAVSFAGIGNRAGATIDDGARRTAISITQMPLLDGNTNSAAHEIGHNHGRAHAPGCGAAGPDPMYPYKAVPGDMGVNGFSLSTSAFKSKMMFRELMAYCRPRWISDYMWNAFEARVRIVTGFVTPGATTMMHMLATRSLQGFAAPGETPDWGIVAGQLVDANTPLSATRYAVLSLSDGRQVRMPVAVSELTEDQAREFAVNLTGADFRDADVVQAEVFADGTHSVVPVNTMFRR